MLHTEAESTLWSFAKLFFHSHLNILAWSLTGLSSTFAEELTQANSSTTILEKNFAVLLCLFLKPNKESKQLKNV